MFLILIPLSPLPCLSLSQCSFPEIEFRQAPGKSEGSTQFKLQLKIFLLDAPTLKRRARVLRIGDKRAAPPPSHTVCRLVSGLQLERALRILNMDF